jgi:hypothetical protein
LLLAAYIAICFPLLIWLNNLKQAAYNPIPLNVASPVLFVLFGVLLGADHFYRQLKAKGKWRVNLSKILFIGIPSACFVVYPLLSFSGINVPSFIFDLFRTPHLLVAIQILLGYTVISGFYKINAGES